MRQMKYLSPSSIALYLEDKVQFYQAYLADTRPPRPPQTEPMAVGSAFDAHVKSYLYNAVVGKQDPRFDLMSIFEAQVESQCRDKAYEAGKYCFEQYKKAGCLADLMLELKNSVTEPRFEIDIMGQVQGYREGRESTLGAVPLLGKPDVYFTNSSNARVIVDWKVNGFYSNYKKYPMKGYVRLRDGIQNYGQHKECFAQMWKGMMINIAHYLEGLDLSWARQLAIYSWLCGEEVGTEMCIAGIDQLVCTPDSVRPYPQIRIAEHRLRMSKLFQHSWFEQIQEIWSIVTSDHFFREVPKLESQQRCEFLDKHGFDKPVANNDEWFKRMSER